MSDSSRRNKPGVGSLLLVALVLLLVLNPHWYLPAVGGWLMLPANPVNHGDAEAIAVLGGGGQQRLRQGIALYEANPDAQLWHTGNLIPDSQRTFIDPAYARDYAVERGVPREAIHLLHSTSTWEDGQSIAREVEAEAVEQVIIVTNYFHSRRAMCVMRHHLAGRNITLLYQPPASDNFDPATWWQNEQDLVDVTEEWLKVMLYWQRYGLAPWQC